MFQQPISITKSEKKKKARIHTLKIRNQTLLLHNFVQQFRLNNLAMCKKSHRKKFTKNIHECMQYQMVFKVVLKFCDNKAVKVYNKESVGCEVELRKMVR